MENTLPLNTQFDGLMILLAKLESLIEVAKKTDMTELGLDAIFHYFCVMGEIAAEARCLCDGLVTRQ